MINHKDLNGDDVIAILREKTIAADDATHQDDAELQHRLADEAGSIAETLERRDGWHAFTPLLKDVHPAVRLMAAARIAEHDQTIAFPILEDLRDSAGGAVASDARMTLKLLRQRAGSAS